MKLTILAMILTLSTWASLPPAKEPAGTIPCGTVPSCGTIPQATPTEDVSDPPTATPTVTPTVTPTETIIPSRTPTPTATSTPIPGRVYKTYLPIVSKH